MEMHQTAKGRWSSPVRALMASHIVSSVFLLIHSGNPVQCHRSSMSQQGQRLTVAMKMSRKTSIRQILAPFGPETNIVPLEAYEQDLCNKIWLVSSSTIRVKKISSSAHPLRESGSSFLLCQCRWDPPSGCKNSSLLKPGLCIEDYPVHPGVLWCRAQQGAMVPHLDRMPTVKLLSNGGEE